MSHHDALPISLPWMAVLIANDRPPRSGLVQRKSTRQNTRQTK
ncbi:DUF3099 domain-containing protein [Mycobacterium kansasii]